MSRFLPILCISAVGVVLLAGLISFYSFTTGSFVSMSNYSAMNQKTRYASDVLSRDVRGAMSVDGATTSNKLVLDMPDGTPITYLYNYTNGTVVRTKSGESIQLLSGIQSLSFSMFQRPTNRSAAYEAFPTANTADAKLVGFQWICSQKVIGSQTNAQRFDSGIIELRNQ